MGSKLEKHIQIKPKHTATLHCLDLISPESWKMKRDVEEKQFELNEELSDQI